MLPKENRILSLPYVKHASERLLKSAEKEIYSRLLIIFCFIEFKCGTIVLTKKVYVLGLQLAEPQIDEHFISFNHP